MIGITAFPFTSELTYDAQGWPQLDRAVTATVLRRCLANYYRNGVFLTADANCFRVYAPTDASPTVKVSKGVGLINGATGYTEEVQTLDLPAAHTAMPRIDTVVLRLNDNTDYRNLYLDIIQGTPATAPVRPALTQTDSVWEIGLADIMRAPNSTAVTDANITDTRADSSRCGQVVAIISFDTSVMMAQLNAYYTEFVAKCDEDYETSRSQYLQQCEAILASMHAFETATETDILAWYERIKDIIDESAAVHLQNEIDEIIQQQFLDLYGLCNKVTHITKDALGATESIVENTEDGQVIATTTFAEVTGSKVIRTEVVPEEGSFKYIKTATFTTVDANGSKEITEAYTKVVK